MILILCLLLIAVLVRFGCVLYISYKPIVQESMGPPKLRFWNRTNSYNFIGGVDPVVENSNPESINIIPLSNWIPASNYLLNSDINYIRNNEGSIIGISSRGFGQVNPNFYARIEITPQTISQRTPFKLKRK